MARVTAFRTAVPSGTGTGTGASTGEDAGSLEPAGTEAVASVPVSGAEATPSVETTALTGWARLRGATRLTAVGTWGAAGLRSEVLPGASPAPSSAKGTALDVGRASGRRRPSTAAPMIA